VERAASEPEAEMDGVSQSDCDTAAVADAMEGVNRLEGLEDVIRDWVAATETILVAEEVTLPGSVFEVEGEGEKEGVSIELLVLLNDDSNPLALA